MTIRSVLAGGSVAVVAAAALPAIAQAAPVVPKDAVLTAQEFPPGSHDYKTFPMTFPAVGTRPANSSRCAVKTHELQQRLAGSSAVEAEAWRGDTMYYASVFGRPVAEVLGEQNVACDMSPRERRVPAPADLARVNPTAFRSGSQRIEATAELHGVTVGVVGTSPDGKVLDTDTFWEILRAQIAKIERQ
ncbi:hypothetical protein GCM10009551_102220 [Nocardiopsis tropica]|uniref:hypothetical protein n=1 Tax=Tsukamurella strandjordii TaxID=147577 RepID=UPI0031D02265